MSLLLPDPALERRLLERTGRAQTTASLRRELEVDAVARLVRQILEPAGENGLWLVRDPASGESRPAGPADVAVLVRRIAWGDALAEELRHLGIPVSVGGGKRFYAREEIATLLAILRAVASPDDEFASFAALRSPAFGYPDDSLVLHYLGESCPAGLPDPREALALFPALRQRARAQSLPDFLEHAVTEISLSSVFGFRLDGPGRIEALRMLLEAGESLEEAGMDTLPGFVHWLGEQSAEARADDLGETEPGSQGGVQVLSIHKAKGLEFPIVIVADLGSGTPRDRALVADRRSGRVEFQLAKNHGIETPGFAAAAEEEDAREHAEAVRLLYVAMTRARDRVVLSWPQAERGILTAEPLAATVGCPPGEAPPAGSGWGVLRTADLPPIADERSRPRVDPEKALRLAARDTHRAAEDSWPAARAHAAGGAPVLPATTLQDEHRPSPAEPSPREEPAGPDFGTLVHRALELYEPGVPDGASAAVALAAPLVVRALSREKRRTVSFDAKLRASAAALVARAVQDPALAPLWSAPRLLREVPFLLPCGERFISGKIDAIREDENGALTIYDYKTERWTPSRRPDLEEAHRTQALAYALATTEIARRPVLAVRLLLLTAAPVAQVVYPVDSAFLEEGRALLYGLT